jgi:hypothetical protein
VRDHLFRNPACISPDASRIERDGAVEPPRKALDSGFRARDARLSSCPLSIRSRAFVPSRLSRLYVELAPRYPGASRSDRYRRHPAATFACVLKKFSTQRSDNVS